MLTNLSIKNYALIDHLNVTFNNGFTVITGETGAGKSILLGGLSLVLGKRADLSSLRDKSQKCIIEAEFEIDNYNLQSFFQKNDVDYDDNTIVRREILPSGKSRAFVNDSPVTLSVLTNLGNALIDIHSQHQTLQLGNNDFQLKMIDALADNSKKLKLFTKDFENYKQTEKQLAALIDVQQNANAEQDYNSFLLKELESAPLREGILEELEAQYEQLNNVEVILEQLSKGHQILNDEQVGVSNLLAELRQAALKLSSFGGQFSKLDERIQSVVIEIDDLSEEMQGLQEGVEANPVLLGEVSTKLQLLYDLQKKHKVLAVSDLIKIKNELIEKVGVSENIDEAIASKRAELQQKETKLNLLCEEIHNKRNKVIPSLKKQLENMLVVLGMPNASFSIVVNKLLEFNSFGKDDLVFLFSANKGSDYGELRKVASGGELSRIMLAIKSILAKYDRLPTLMFDEIDTGVSGEISNKMGDIMQEMSTEMQIFSITHLPQVASKGKHHFKVFKENSNAITETKMKQLSREERITELAEMLGGKDLSDSAIAHAKQLLN